MISVIKGPVTQDGTQTLQGTFPVWMASSEIGRSAPERNDLI